MQHRADERKEHCSATLEEGLLAALAFHSRLGCLGLVCCVGVASGFCPPVGDPFQEGRHHQSLATKHSTRFPCSTTTRTHPLLSHPLPLWGGSALSPLSSWNLPVSKNLWRSLHTLSSRGYDGMEYC
jgi:hypothetical protein